MGLFARYNCSDLIRGEGWVLPYQVMSFVDWLEHRALTLPMVEFNGWLTETSESRNG